MQPTNRDTTSTSSFPVYHEILSSHSTKRRVSITSRRKLFDESSQDDAGCPENHMGHTGGSPVIRDDVEGPENHMGHAGGSPVTRDDVEGPKNCVEDAQGQRDVQNDAGGHGDIRCGRRVNRRLKWQWNRIFPGGAYTPRKKNLLKKNIF